MPLVVLSRRQTKRSRDDVCLTMTLAREEVRTTTTTIKSNLATLITTTTSNLATLTTTRTKYRMEHPLDDLTFQMRLRDSARISALLTLTRRQHSQ
jgi:hypothetical protein